MEWPVWGIELVRMDKAYVQFTDSRECIQPLTVLENVQMTQRTLSHGKALPH